MKYEEIKQLEARLVQLKLFKNYLIHFCEGVPFNVELKTSVFGHKSVQPFFPINRNAETNTYGIFNPEDKKSVLDAIDGIIFKLEETFKKETE